MKSLVLLCVMSILYVSSWGSAFITTWQTDLPGSSNSDQITIPTYFAETYDYTVDWGDGTQDVNVTGSITHTYPSPGVYTVSISGVFPRIYFQGVTDSQKLLSIDQWGNNPWTTMFLAFSGCSNMNVLDIASPNLSNCTQLTSMFRDCEALNFDANSWDVSNITTLSGMFWGCTNFNGNISSWDVSGVENFAAMFSDAWSFNQDISGWQTTSALTMARMFETAVAFDQNLNSWNVSGVTDMFSMFRFCTALDQSFDGWNITSVEDMGLMFQNAGISPENYDTTLLSWGDPSNTPQLDVDFNCSTFYCAGASARQNLIDNFNWTITDFGEDCQILGCTDPTACNYDPSADTEDGSCLFGIDACGVCGGAGTLAGCTDPSACNYNETADCDDGSCDYSCGFITTWVTTSDNESITIPTFGGGYNYNVNWGDGNTTTGHTGNATHVFATSGSQTITITGDFPRIFSFLAADASKIYEVNQWGGIQWETFSLAFIDCANLNILATDAPDLSLVTEMNDAFSGTNVQSPDLSNWDVSTVIEMVHMFSDCPNFNGNISSWDVSSLENAGHMFDGADSFNGDLSGWDLSSALYLHSMFKDAISFNSDISGWNVSSVVDMDFMFFGATAFNQDINNWDVSSVVDMSQMFWEANSFLGAIYNWDIGSLQFGDNMLRNSGIIQANYDQILINWSQLPMIPTGISLNEVPSFYCPGAAGRAELIDTHGWNIIDFGINCPGCTDPTACNFDPGAVIDDGSCAFFIDACGNCGGTGTAPGCIDENALNYCGYADCDDGSCIYGEDICGECTIWDEVSGQCIADPTCQGPGSCLGDFNEDNLINAADLLTFLGVFGTTCAE